MNTLMADSTLSAEHIRIVASALHLINSTNVLQPDLDGQIRTGQVSIDRDTEAWLFTELAKRERTYTANVNKVKAAAGNPGNAVPPVTESPYYMSGLKFDFNPFDAILEGLDLHADDGASVSRRVPGLPRLGSLSRPGDVSADGRTRGDVVLQPKWCTTCCGRPRSSSTLTSLSWTAVR